MIPPPRRIFLLNLPFLALMAVQLACGAAASPPGLPPPASATDQPDISTPQQPAVPERRLLTLEYPAVLRLGEAGRVVLTLEVDERGNLTPGVQFEGTVIQGETLKLPNVYETHNLMAEARLDMTGAFARPADLISETLLPGQKLFFYWSIRPQQAGHYHGTVWFYLRFIPKDGGPAVRQTLSAQPIDLEAVTLFGLKAGPARWLGMLGAALGVILGLPYARDAIKWIHSKVRARR